MTMTSLSPSQTERVRRVPLSFGAHYIRSSDIQKLSNELPQSTQIGVMAQKPHQRHWFGAARQVCLGIVKSQHGGAHVMSN